MRIQTMIMLEGSERALLGRLQTALNLVGYHSDSGVYERLAKEHKEKRLKDFDRHVFEDLKAVRRVRSDMFSLEDLDRVKSYITRKAQGKKNMAQQPPFDEEYLRAMPNANIDWQNGMRATADLALRELAYFSEEFSELLHETKRAA